MTTFLTLLGVFGVAAILIMALNSSRPLVWVPLAAAVLIVFVVVSGYYGDKRIQQKERERDVVCELHAARVLVCERQGRVILRERVDADGQ